MPSENFHVCEINTSLKVVGSQKRSHEGKSYTVRIGRPKTGSGGSSEYEYMYPKDEWSEAQARTHCKDHNGRFVAALKSQETEDPCDSNPFIPDWEDYT